MNTTQAINGELRVGDYVIIVPDDDYGYLVGQVKAIDKLGTPEHDTGNPGDDIHVDFSVFSYPPWQQNDFAEDFNDLFDYDEYKGFTELPLDDVIIAPDAIISLTGISDEKINNFITDPDAAERFCNQILQDFDVNREEQLIERVDRNFTDYKSALLGFDKRELIDMAGKIAAMQDVHEYMTTSRGFSDEELQFYLQFQNPLEVVADAWLKRNAANEDLSFTMDFVYERNGKLLTEYPLMSDIDAFADDPIHHRYMGVDLIDFLGKIAENVIIHYPNDWKTDINALNRASGAENPEDRRLMWHVSSYGTHLNTERDTFIKDTGAFNTWVNYRANEPDMFGYFVEVTGKNGQIVTGNVFEVGYYSDHARYVRETALPLDSVTLTYSGDWGVNAGKSITVPSYEYDDDRNRLMSESGNVISIQYHPSESVREMSALLQSERSRRMSYPIGSMDTHLKKLSETLLEVRASPDDIQVESASRDAMQTYNMQEDEFEKRMAELLPNCNPAVMPKWISYANSLDFDNVHPASQFFLEMFVEFTLVKQHYGEQIALQLFNLADENCLNPFEVRGAANLLKDGTEISKVFNLAIEGECDRTSLEWQESEQAIKAFLSEHPTVAVRLTEQQQTMINELSERTDRVQLTHPKLTDTQSEVRTPPEPPADKKRSISDRISAGNEKVRAYKEQKAQNPESTTKHKKEDILQ